MSTLKFEQRLKSWLLPLCYSIALGGGVGYSSLAQAQAVRTLSAAQAQQSTQTITVWPGAGLNLSVIPTGEVIEKAWLDDPSRITLDFDGSMCSNEESCSESAATVVHLRRIHSIAFPSLPRTASTLLTIVTSGSQGRKLYTFKVAYGTGTPQYHTVAVQPESQGSKPESLQSDLDVDALWRGVIVAERRQWLSRQSALWSKLQNFLGFARTGMSASGAAQKAGISMALVNRLVELGNHIETSPTPKATPLIAPGVKSSVL